MFSTVRHFVASIFFFGVLSAGCQTFNLQPTAEMAFKTSVDQFLTDYWKVHPEKAAAFGLQAFEGQLVIFDTEQKKRNLAFIRKYRSVFGGYKDGKLTPSQRIDRDLILNDLSREEWLLNVFQPWAWQPAYYNIGRNIGSLLQSDRSSFEEKMAKVAMILDQAPAYYAQAKKNITGATKAHLEFGIQQNRGVLAFLKKTVVPQVRSSRLSNKPQLFKKIAAASDGIKGYISFLEKTGATLADGSSFRDFRIGPKLYEEKFEYEVQSRFSAKEIYKRALSDRKKTHKKMSLLANQLWPKYFPNTPKKVFGLKDIQKLIGEISKKHSKPAEFIQDIRQQIPDLARFVREKNLLYLDPSKPLKVRETPEYLRGFAGASVDAPGPFDPDRETFYNVSPLDGMTKSQQQSWLREYNHYTLQILNIHEAIPGHYTQLVYDNKNPSLIKTVFHNGALVEGWAVYAERLMIEAGYGRNTPELEFMYWKWFLRVVTNTILDYEIHNMNLSKAKGLSYMVDQAFQEQEEAEKKWKRAMLSQVQLTYYYTGFTEIYSFRESLKSEQKESFSLKRFNEKLLNFGSAPVKTIQALWNEPRDPSQKR